MTTSSVGSAMRRTVAPTPQISYQRAAGWLVAAAATLRARVSTVKEWAHHPEKSVFVRGKRLLRQAVLHGNRDWADEKMAELELAFIGAPTEPLEAVLLAKAELDAAEEIRRTAFLQSQTTGEHRAYRRSVLQEVTAGQRLLKALDASGKVC